MPILKDIANCTFVVRARGCLALIWQPQRLEAGGALCRSHHGGALPDGPLDGWWGSGLATPGLRTQ
jgi:hypothetical protein